MGFFVDHIKRPKLGSYHRLLYPSSLVGCSVAALSAAISVPLISVVLVAESQHIAALRQVQSQAQGLSSHCGHVAIWLNVCGDSLETCFEILAALVKLSNPTIVGTEVGRIGLCAARSPMLIPILSHTAHGISPLSFKWQR